MLKITLIKIIFQIKIYNINISGKTIDNSNKYIIKKINLLNTLLTLCKISFIIYLLLCLLSNNIAQIQITNY